MGEGRVERKTVGSGEGKFRTGKSWKRKVVIWKIWDREELRGRRGGRGKS